MKILLGALLALLLAGISSAQVVLTRIDGSFSVTTWELLFGQPGLQGLPNPDFPDGVQGTFSITLNVPQTGSFYAGNLQPDSVTVTPAFGSTTFSPANTGLELDFFDGQIRVALLGGLVDGIGGWGPSPTSDFELVLTDSIYGYFFYEIDASYTNLYSASVVGSILQTPVVTAVPEPSTFGFTGAVLAVGLSLLRRRSQRCSAA